MHSLLRRIRAARPQVELLARRAADSVDRRDLFVFGGLASMGYGIGQIYAPAAWVVVGAIVFLIGMRGS